MEENFGLTWEDSTTVVQTEEVICGIENEILPSESEEFTGVEDEHIVEEEVISEHHHDAEVQDNNSGASVLYLPNGNVVVVHGQSQHYNPQDESDLGECQVTTEDVITDHWTEGCAEEIVVGSEEAVGAEEVGNDECEVPLPTCQDEYTAARPYPCDFCSRRFRKKGNLMNHMVAHQTDKPHGCNLCGVRYIRKCDLMNHLKIHAYIPEPDGVDDEEVQTFEEYEEEKSKRKKPTKRRKKSVKIKDEYDSFEGDEGIEGASTSRNYSYIQEDNKLLEQVPTTEEKSSGYVNLQDEQPVVERYPVLDPRKPFVCQHCGVGFAREKAFLSHTRLHADGDSPFECQKCGDMFWDHNLMREHAKEKHGDVEDFDDDDDEDEDYSDEETKFGTFYCSTCGLSFHRQDNLRRHQRVHVKEEFVTEHEFGHVCSVCGESFEEALDLLAHAEVHARNVDYRCMICGDVMQDENSLAVHVQTKHGKTLPANTCMLCGKTCKDRRTLLKHSWDHSKEKLFACSKCAKTFHNKARLKRHMLSHRSKVVSCDVCNEEFPDGRSLMNHRHSHSSVSGRQFPCWECGKTFGSRSSQQIHIRIHTGERPYGCRFCWKAFADGGTLRKHERIHTGEKPYACAVCPRAFNQRVVLREHIRSHHSGPDPKYSNSMTPYCCSVCSDMFTTSQDLILHLIHHCDLNTAMKRQPQIGPRKYKRRRKLKPHELEMISSRNEEDDNLEASMNNTFSDSDDDRDRRRKYSRKQSKKIMATPKEPTIDPYIEQYDSTLTAVESITSPTPPAIKMSPAKGKMKKSKNDHAIASRPKMIHTQKTRVPMEATEDGRVRHKTKTLITRTQPTEIKSAIGERIRPRTKNVSYHILQPEKLPVATFPMDEQLEQQIDASQLAVDALLKEENIAAHEVIDDMQINGTASFDEPPEIASEQVIETEEMESITDEKRTRTRSSSGGSLKSVRNVIGPGSKVRLIKEGMIVSKARTLRKSEEAESECFLPEMTTPEDSLVVVKEEIINNSIMPVKQEVIDPSPLHELAEISMQHAHSITQSLFKCEMCSEVFSDRAQLLVHVPIHI